ncbi:hypothetical protein LIER_04367 [Lithospermum erythrorhizon]|uniref:Uncharacterized protein n=1 Tax=Lithospermum erythrorhizon TaxID=34254 RepID=A0AAV3NWG5_LITER
MEAPKSYKEILTQPEENEELQLYLVVTDGAVSSVLVREEAKVKAQALADFIIECTTRAPQEDPNNPKGSGAGILIQGPEGLRFEYALRFSFKTTNNEAEYEAIVTGLLLAQSLSITRIVVRGDSKLVIEQIRGDCGVKSESLQKYHAKATSLVAGFDCVVFEHIPRRENEHADHLSRLATTYYEDIPLRVHIEHRERSIYEEVRIFPTRLGREDWRSPIVKFLTTGELPEEKVKTQKFQSRSYKFLIFQEELYKVSQLGLLMYCVPKEKVSQTLKEVDEGDYGHHIGGRALASKITLAGYYWPTLMVDSLEYVKKYDSCQKIKAVPKKPMVEITPVLFPIPFAMWGVDLVGQFVKPATKYKDVVVVVDYFSKWVEEITLRNTTAEDIEKFIWTNIITLYGIPKILVSNNGPQFDSSLWSSMLPPGQWKERVDPTKLKIDLGTEFLHYGNRIVDEEVVVGIALLEGLGNSFGRGPQG